MLRKISGCLDALNERVGKCVSWLVLLMVLTSFVIALLRYLFQVGWVWMQEIVVYSHATVFLLAAGYALSKDAHVRVDVFSRKTSPAGHARIQIFGTLFLLWPMVGLIFFKSMPFVLDSWRVLEGSKDGGGLEAVFLLKSLIPIFCMLLFFQGGSEIIKSVLVLKSPKNSTERGSPHG